MIGNRGGDFYAAFNSAATLTTVDALVYVSASNTVNVMPAAVGAAVPIGTLVQKSTGGAGSPCGVNLFTPTKKGIAGASLNAGDRLTVQSSTGYLITAAGTLTGVPIVGVAVVGAGGSGYKFEYLPLYFSSIVIA